MSLRSLPYPRQTTSNPPFSIVGRLLPGPRKIEDFSWSGDYLPELIRNNMYMLLQNVFVEEDAPASPLLQKLQQN